MSGGVSCGLMKPRSGSVTRKGRRCGAGKALTRTIPSSPPVCEAPSLPHGVGVSEAVQRSLTGQCWCGSSGVRVRRCELCLAVTGPLQPGVARMGGRTVIASVLAAMLGVLMMGVLSPNKAPFRRIDFTPSAVHGTTSFSQITMDVYGRLHTYRPTP
ncbi:hypothetical protein O3P69_016240 [Scylla paramamosain]|uniref:Uncharacterized protein n=1 Tax=Scylla paramamosain TaxID=85552 RepID=A0AAW0S9S9_SCYPA